MKIKVKVKPSASEDSVEKISDEEYIVSLKARAEDGKGNVALVKLLKRYFKDKEVRISSGFASRKKIVEVL